MYDPSVAYLGAPVFYAPQAYATVPGQFRFPAAKAHIAGRGLMRTPSVRGEETPDVEHQDARRVQVHAKKQRKIQIRISCLIALAKHPIRDAECPNGGLFAGCLYIDGQESHDSSTANVYRLES